MAEEMKKDEVEYYLFDLNQISSDGFRLPYTKHLFKLFQSYGLSVSSLGEFMDNETQKFVRRNHLKCMLRRDYLEKYGVLGIAGRALDKLIEGMFEGLSLATAKLAEAPDELKDFGTPLTPDGTFI